MTDLSETDQTIGPALADAQASASCHLMERRAASPFETLAARIPPRPFVPASLHAAGASLRGALHRIMPADGLRRPAPPRWGRGRSALTAIHHLDRATSSLATLPFAWARFHEPQITEGIIHFVENQPLSVARARAAALFAAAEASNLLTGRIVRVRATGQDDRTDVRIEAWLSDGQSAVLQIEAKFGDALTVKQLRRYEAALRTSRGRSNSVGPSALLVLAPTLNDAAAAVLRRAANWRFVTWHRFILRIDAALPADADDEEFRRFRRTIWHRADQ